MAVGGGTVGLGVRGSAGSGVKVGTAGRISGVGVGKGGVGLGKASVGAINSGGRVALALGKDVGTSVRGWLVGLGVKLGVKVTVAVGVGLGKGVRDGLLVGVVVGKAKTAGKVAVNGAKGAGGGITRATKSAVTTAMRAVRPNSSPDNRFRQPVRLLITPNQP